MNAMKREARRRNTANMAKAVAQLDRMLREASLAEPPMKKFDDAIARARATLDKLAKKALEAKTLLAEAERRKLRGAYDQRLMLAETLAPYMVFAFHEAFEEMFLRAANANTSYPMKRLNIAASVLLGQIESCDLLVAKNYPKNNAALKEKMIQENMFQLKAAYDDVCQALDNMHTVLGVELPSSSL